MSNGCGFSLSVGQNETHRRFRLNRLFLSFAITCILFGFVMQMDAQEMNFKAVDCGWLAGINDAGVAIGNGDSGGFLYKDGKCTPAAIGGRLLAIANNGDILSTDGTDYFITGADGTRKIGLTVPLPVSDGSTRIGFITKITGINSSGQIVGNFGSGDATYSIYGTPNLSEPGSATAPAPSDHFTIVVCDNNGTIQRTMANAINDAGQIVGTCGLRGFILQGGTFTYFSGPTGTTFTNPTAISSSGVIVGGYQATRGIQQNAFIYNGGGSIQPLNPLGMPQSTALGVNSKNIVVGSYQKTLRQGALAGFISGPPKCANVPVPGDIVLYQNKEGGFNHVAMITPKGVLVDSNCNATVTEVESKWGSGALFKHDPDDTLYGTWKVYHSRLPGDHSLILVDGHLQTVKGSSIRTCADSGCKPNPSPTLAEDLAGIDRGCPNLSSHLHVQAPPSSSYDCRGFVFFHGKAVIPDTFLFTNQVSTIIDDYEYVVVPAKGTGGHGCKR